MNAGSKYAYIGKDEVEEMELDNEEVKIDDIDIQNNNISSPSPISSSTTNNNINNNSGGGFFSRLFGSSSSSTSSNINGVNNIAPPAPAPAPPKSKKVVKKANTNILNINLGTLVNESSIATGDPVFCASCKVVFSNINTFTTLSGGDGTTFPNVPTDGGYVDGKWTCEFCGELSSILLSPEEVPKSNVVDYVLEPAPITSDSNNNNTTTTNTPNDDQSYVIFCIDTSGSMQQSYEVKDGLTLRNKNKPPPQAYQQQQQYQQTYGTPKQYISRLQCVQYGIEAQLEALEKEYPNRRVGIVTFDNKVTIIGDGQNKQVIVSGDTLNKVPELLQAGSQYEMTTPLSKSRHSLLKKVLDLDANGSTALGPAVAVAIGMASKSRGSKIVLCTDGLSNVGVGAIETGASAKVEEFFTQMADAAISNGTLVSVLTIKGTDTKLEELGKLAEKTSGEVNIVDPLKLQDDFKSVLALPVLATHVSIKVRLHRGLYIQDPGQASTNSSFIDRDIGNVNEDTTISFEYGVNANAAEKYDFAKIKSLPFQLQIYYSSMKGMKCVRVLTLTKETTTNQEDAIEHADIDAIGVNLVQTAAKIASTGDYQQSRARNFQSADLMNKVYKKQQQKLQSAPQTEQQQQMIQQQQQQQQMWSNQAQHFETQVVSTLKKENVNNNANESSQMYQQRRSERNDETANMLFNMKSMNTKKANKK